VGCGLKQVGTRPGGRCDMRSFRITTDYRLSQMRSISAGKMYTMICV